MPSGSHRSSGGSHSSGGSSRSSSSSSRSSSSYSSYSRRYSNSHTGWHHEHYHGGVVINGIHAGPIGTIIFYVLFLIFFSGAWTAGGFIMGSVRKANIEKAKQDYTYYQNMIEFAEYQRDVNNDDSYIITGIVTGKFLSEYENKWYLEYSFTSNNGYSTYFGETRVIYDFNDIKNIIPNVTTIELAADSPIITSTTDTVNIDYKYTTLEDDGYYIEAKKEMIVPLVVCFVVGFGSAALFIFLIIKEVKKLKARTPQESSNGTAVPELNTEYKKSYCVYCGSEIAENKRKCSNCGAKIE